jgi:hypothetical protein
MASPPARPRSPARPRAAHDEEQWAMAPARVSLLAQPSGLAMLLRFVHQQCKRECRNRRSQRSR